MAPNLPLKIIGIRPGEKLHEVMCPADLCYDTFEFDDHFVIAPGIKFSGRQNNFDINGLNEKGKQVNPGFEYNSLDNPNYLTLQEINEFNRKAL